MFEAALVDREAHFYDEDLIGPMLSNNLAADPLPASHDTSNAAAGQMRERFLIGRVIGVLMNKNDLLNKLGRHEAHLMRQVEKTLVQLRALRAERAEMTIKEDPKEAAGGRATDVIVDDRSIADVVEALEADLSSTDGSRAPENACHSTSHDKDARSGTFTRRTTTAIAPASSPLKDSGLEQFAALARRPRDNS